MAELNDALLRCDSGQMILHKDTFDEVLALPAGRALTFTCQGTQLALITVDSLRSVLAVIDPPEEGTDG